MVYVTTLIWQLVAHDHCIREAPEGGLYLGTRVYIGIADSGCFTREVACRNDGVVEGRQHLAAGFTFLSDQLKRPMLEPTPPGEKEGHRGNMGITHPDFPPEAAIRPSTSMTDPSSPQRPPVYRHGFVWCMRSGRYHIEGNRLQSLWCRFVFQKGIGVGEREPRRDGPGPERPETGAFGLEADPALGIDLGRCEAACRTDCAVRASAHQPSCPG